MRGAHVPTALHGGPRGGAAAVCGRGTWRALPHGQTPAGGTEGRPTRREQRKKTGASRRPCTHGGRARGTATVASDVPLSRSQHRSGPTRAAELRWQDARPPPAPWHPSSPPPSPFKEQRRRSVHGDPPCRLPRPHPPAGRLAPLRPLSPSPDPLFIHPPADAPLYPPVAAGPAYGPVSAMVVMGRVAVVAAAAASLAAAVAATPVWREEPNVGASQWYVCNVGEGRGRTRGAPR